MKKNMASTASISDRKRTHVSDKKIA